MPVKVYFDGGCKPNPGKMEVAVIIDVDGKKTSFHERLGFGSNNEAEWLALLWALDICQKSDFKDVEVKGDSQLIVNQANGSWKCKKAELKPYLAAFLAAKENFSRLSLTYVGREDNPAGSHIESVN